MFHAKTPKPAATISGNAANVGSTLVFENEGRVIFEAPASNLAEHPITVGRDSSCDWCTAGVDGSISSRHAELFRKRGSVWIRDLGSRNGIFIKGERVKEHRIAVGDTVLVGACKITLEPPRQPSGASKSAFHRLEQLNGPGGGRVLEIVGESDIVMGSDSENEIFIADTLVSRRHAKLAFKKNECWVSDLGSRNGTFVNGTPVTKERLLRDGDVLAVAYVEFRFYDKNVAHVDAHVGRKILVAAATVAFGILGFSIWSLMRPNAGRLLYKAERLAALWTPESKAEDFAHAFAVLDEAAVAGNIAKYASVLAEQKARMEAWTNTISGWRDVRNLLQNEKWVSARTKFHTLTSWTWPSPSAAKAHRESDTVLVLVNAFLDARSDLRSGEFQPSAIAGRFRANARALESALKDAPAAEERKYIRPLRVEAEDLLGEFRHSLEVLDTIPRMGESLRTVNGRPPAPDAATKSLARLKGILEDEKRHERERIIEADERKLPQPYFSPLVAERVAASLAPLEALASGERQVAANVNAIAAAEWDAVKRNLAFPERSVTDVDAAYQNYRDWLVAENAQFCGTDKNPFAGVDTTFKAAMKSFEGRGFGPNLSSLPSALESLLRPETLDGVLRFIDPVSDPVPDASDSRPVCAYDGFVGLKAFAEFLDTLAEAALSSGEGGMVDADALRNAVNEYVANTDRLPWRPLVAVVRELQGHLRSFMKRPDEKVSVHPDVEYAGPILSQPARIIMDARPQGRPNRCAEAVANAATILRRIDDWLSDDLPDAAEGDGSRRAAMLAEGVAIILSDPKDLTSQKTRRRAADLGRSASGLRRELKAIAARAETTEPTTIYREVVSTGVPAVSPPFIGAWRNLRRQGEAAQ